MDQAEINLVQNVGMEMPYLDLSALNSNQAAQNSPQKPASRNKDEFGYNYETMRSSRLPSGILTGYLVKTAQTLSKFQRKKFYMRYYELDMERKEMKVFEKNGGALKDQITCEIAHVVTCLHEDLRDDYASFLAKESYQGVTVDLPQTFKHPFAVFFQSGSMQLLFAANQHDYSEWTQAFQQMCCSPEQALSTGNFQYSEQAPNVPIPDQNEQNYFVATIYLCLLPADMTQTDINGIKTDRQIDFTPEITKLKAAKKAKQAVMQEIIVTKNSVRGYMLKTVQSKSMLQKHKFLKRYYTLNAQACTLYIGEDPTDESGMTIEFRTNRLVHVESELKSDDRILAAQFKSNSASARVEMPDGRTEPFGLVFSNGNLMLLWAKPGQEIKYWCRAFRRFVNPSLSLSSMQDQMNEKSFRTVVLAQKSENSFVLGLFRELIPYPNPNFEVQADQSNTIEGWLCKTTECLPQDDGKAFLKTYAVLDFNKKMMFLCDSTNGLVVEKIELSQKLRCIDTSITGTIKTEQVTHTLAEKQLLENLQTPLAYVFPFALVFSDGTFHLFWANSEVEVQKWNQAFSNIVTQPPEQEIFANYILRTNKNAFLFTLYLALVRKVSSSVEVKNEHPLPQQNLTDQPKQEQEETKGQPTQIRESKPDDSISGKFFQSVWQPFLDQDSANNNGQDIQMFREYRFRISVDEQRLQAFEIGSEQLEYEIDLTNKITLFVTNLSNELIEDSMEITDGLIEASKVKLPTMISPIAVHIINGGLILLWPTEDSIKTQFAKAFQRIQNKNQSDTQEAIWSTVDEQNSFQVGLYRCLVPKFQIELGTMQFNGNLCNEVRFALPRLREMQDMIPKSFVRILDDRCLLQVENEYYQRQFNLMGRLSSVESNLKNELDPNFMDELNQNLMNLTGEVQLPEDEFQHPLCLTFVDGEILILFLPSADQALQWMRSLSNYLPEEDPTTKYLVESKQNKFVVFLYKFLLRVSKPPNDTVSCEEHDIDLQPVRFVNQAEVVTGWLSRTQGKLLEQGQESFLYRFFRLNKLTGILSEHEDQNKKRKLNEIVLLRKIVWVETNLSNELCVDFKEKFKLISDQNVPDGFALPSINVKPICLHLVDGDLVLLWASAKREYQKWLTAFQQLQIPIRDNKKDKRLKLFIKVSPQNCFTVAVQQCIKVAVQRNQVDPQISARDQEIKGQCLKTALEKSEMEYAVSRYYQLDYKNKQLMLMKSEKGSGKKTFDLRDLTWMDSNLTNKLNESYKSIFMKNDIGYGTIDGEFKAASVFKFPLAMGFRDGSLQLLWFEFEWETKQMAEMLILIIRSNSGRGCSLHDYILQTKKSSFVASVYRALKQRNKEQNLIIQGVFEIAQNEKEIMVERFVELNTATGVMSIFIQAYQDLEQEYHLRSVVLIKDLSQERKSVQLANDQTLILQEKERLLAFHSGSNCFVFKLKSQAQFDKWTKALAMLQKPEWNTLQLWVDSYYTGQVTRSIIHKLAPMVTQEGQLENMQHKGKSGFLCKTAQSINNGIITSKMYYRRHYTIDIQRSEMLARANETSAVKERFDLTRLIKVDDSLRTTLCPQYRQFMRRQHSGKISPPRDYGFPFALLFDNGLTLLWAPNESERQDWIATFKTYLPTELPKYRIHQRCQMNRFVATLYHCLRPDLPTMLLEQKFEVQDKENDDDLRQNTRSNLEGKVDGEEESKELVAAMMSAQGSMEGFLYKTSQTLGFFQNEHFHMRYYRLNMRMMELRIFSKADGPVKSRIDLNQRIVKVVGDLKRSITQDDAQQLGVSTRSPMYTYPFAVFTLTETMVLWAESQEDREKWVKAFESCLLSTDQSIIDGYTVIKTKKNQFVVGIYDCIRVPDSINITKTKKVPARAGSTPAPAQRHQNQPDTSASAQNVVNKFSAEKDKPLSQLSQREQIESFVQNQSQQETLQEFTPERNRAKADLQQQLKDMASEDEEPITMRQMSSSRISLQSKSKLTKVSKQESQEQDEGEDRQAESQRVDQLKIIALANMPSKPPGSFRRSARGGRSNRSGPSQQATAEAVENAYMQQDATVENTSRPGTLNNSLVGSPQRPITLRNKALGPAQSLNYSNISISNEKRPGRKLRLPSNNSQRGPIKIKKMVPLKDATKSDVVKFKQNLLGKMQQTSDMTTVKPMTMQDGFMQRNEEDEKVESKPIDDEESDDDIERDPAAEIIRAPFRRYQQAGNQDSQKKFRVKIRGRSQANARLPDNETFVSHQQKDLQQQVNSLRYQFHTPAKDENFEEKVNNQVSKDFIDQLISRGKDGAPLRRSVQGRSAWGDVAQSLRDRIKQTAQNQVIAQNLMQPQCSQTLANQPTQLSNRDMASQYSLRLPLKASAPIKAQMPFQTANQKDPEIQLNKDIYKNQDQARSAAMSRNEYQDSTQGNMINQLSDWDDSSDDNEAEHSMNISRNSLGYRPKKTNLNSSFVNLRDRTSGLANVFTSQVLTASQFDYQANKQRVSGGAFQRKFKSSYKRLEEPEIEPTIDVQIDADNIEEDIVRPAPQGDSRNSGNLDLPPQNANDCIAESYNSVWE